MLNIVEHERIIRPHIPHPPLLIEKRHLIIADQSTPRYNRYTQ